ncbi:MAG: hypothetical protein ACK5GZ_11530 [Cyanobium sp.]
MNIASKRRQGGKVETHVDRSEQPLVMGGEAAEVEEAVIAVVCCERNQQQQDAREEG